MDTNNTERNIIWPENGFASNVPATLGESPSVVLFYSDWCPASRLARVIFEQVAADYAHREDAISFVKIPTERYPSLAAGYKIRAIPTLVFECEGRVVDTIVGKPNRTTLETLVGNFARSLDPRLGLAD